MNKLYCEACGKLLNDEDEKFTNEAGLVICRKCHEAFSSKDNYSSDGGYVNYGNSAENNSVRNSNSTNGNVWTKYLKIVCYIIWAAVTIIFAMIGGGIFDSEGIGLLLGGAIGFAIGFSNIAVVMAFISLCEDISTIRRDTSKILNDLNNGKIRS